MSEMLAPYMPVISLIVLAIVVAIGFIKKVNLGFLSLGVAFILATVSGLSALFFTGPAIFIVKLIKAV